MLVFRNVMGVSASLLLVLSSSVATKAQQTPPNSINQTSTAQPLEAIPSVSATPETTTPGATGSPNLDNPKKDQLGQIDLDIKRPPTIKTPAPEGVNPNSNPLNFPTKPEEVKSNLTPITLSQAIEIAIRNNKQLEGARVVLDRSTAQLRESVAAQFPSLDLNTDFEYGDSAIQELQNIQLLQNNPTATPNDETSATIVPQIELSYNIYTGGRIGANVIRAEKQLRRDQLEVEVTLEDTRFTATRDYYALQNADAQVAIEQARVEDATQTLRDAQLLEQAGLGTRFDVLQAEVQLANANQTLTRAIADQRSARVQLAQTLSVAPNIQLTAAEEIRESGTWSLPLEDSVVLAFKNRAELEQQLLDREVSEQDRRIALSDRLPQVSLFANYNLYDDFNDSFEVTDGYGFGARLRWNLFDGGRAQARAQQAESNIALAETRFADQRNQVRLQVEQAYYDLIANKENIATSQQSIVTARESLRLARLRFQAGVGTQTDVINSQTELTTSRGNFLRAIIGYNQALNILQRAVSNYPDTGLFKQP